MEQNQVQIFNFSHHTLDKSEQKILANGLKFVPTPNIIDDVQYKTDIRKFNDSIRRFEYFNDNNNDVEENEVGYNGNLFSNPSRWQPPESTDKTLQNIINKIKTESFEPQINKKYSSNINFNQRTALVRLSKNMNIVIKAADKGGATTIIDKSEYHDSMCKIIRDKNTYCHTPEVTLNALRTISLSFVKRHKNLFTDKEYSYLTEFDVKFGYIYGLPKIHKSKKLKALLESTKDREKFNKDGVFTVPFAQLNIPFRPIVSGKSCPISRLCELAKLILRPFESNISHLIIDTNDFLRKLPNEVASHRKLIAIDIVQLYPSISNALGREALEYWFDKHPENFFRGFDKEFSIKLVNFIQNNVYLTFNDEVYQQINGTAMGKTHAPQYANLTIAYLVIEKLYPAIVRSHGSATALHIKENLMLFLDDGFMMLDESLIKAPDLLTALNTMDTSIQFTMESSEHEIPFLDVLVQLSDGIGTGKIVSTDIYHKPTDSFNYFPFHSCSPKHIPRNIPYNLARRIALIVSDPKTRDEQLEKLRPRLLNKGYPENLINDSIEKAKTYEREVLLQYRKREKNKNTLTLVLDHNPKFIDPSYKIKQNCINLNELEKVKAGKKSVPRIITAKRQPPSLLRLLSLSVKRDHTLKVTRKYEYSKCLDKRCMLCQQVILGQSYTTKTGKNIKCNSNMNCKTRDLIYLLICKNCKSEYVGETGTELNKRMNLHRNQIKNPDYRKLKVSRHISECGRNEFLVFPFQKCSKSCNIYREELELKFRGKIKPSLH